MPTSGVKLRLLFFVCLSLALATPMAAQCSFSIVPASATFSSAGGNGLITITANTSTCARTATSGVPWITISFGTPGTGSGTVGYTVLANTAGSSRTGVLIIAGQTFTVSQAGAACSYNITPASVIASGAGDSGSFN